MNRAIAITLVAVAGFLSAGAQAASILIDFEEVTPQYVVGGPGLDSFIVESKGYSFESYSIYGQVSHSVDSNGIANEVQCGLFVPPGCGGYITMESTGGAGFQVQSIGSYEGYYFGTVVGGSPGYADLSTPIGTGDWLNLESLSINSICGGTGCLLNTHMDNILVSAVPVPPAVWLFGSALAGLGWMRRKQDS